MQFRKKLLSSVFASAAIFGLVGAAQAATFTITVGGVSVPSVGPGAPVANEITLTADAVVGDDPDDGTAVINVDRTAGSFPSGNLVLRLNLVGATFDGALGAGNVLFDSGAGLCTGATASLSTGGTDGSTAVTFVLSNLDTCGTTIANGFNVTLPFDLDAHAASSVTMTLVTESGEAPVDSISAVSIPLTSSVSAYNPDIDLTSSTTAVADVLAAGGAYRAFTGPSATAVIGDVELAVNTLAAVNLAGAGPSIKASAADVTAATFVLSGDTTAYSTGTVQVAAAPAAVIAGGTATTTFDAGGLTALVSASAGGALNGSDQAITLTANKAATQIVSSTYTGTLSYTLSTGTDSALTAVALTPVTRNGTSIVLPWTASNTQAAGTGSNNFVRVSNPTATAYGKVIATVLSGTVSALVGTSATLTTSVAAGGEVVFTAEQLETALGNFGRADIQISVEGTGAIVKRLIQRTDGTYEISNVASPT